MVEKTEEMFYPDRSGVRGRPRHVPPPGLHAKAEGGRHPPDPQTWCNGFVEAMDYYREDWEKFLATEAGFPTLAAIIMTSDPDEWEDVQDVNPVAKLTPWEICVVLKNSHSGHPLILVQL